MGKYLVINIVILILIISTSSVAFDPPRGLSWGMTKAQVDSVCGIEFEFLAANETDGSCIYTSTDTIFDIRAGEYNCAYKDITISKDDKLIDMCVCYWAGDRVVSNMYYDIEKILIMKYGKPSPRNRQFRTSWTDKDESMISISVINANGAYIQVHYKAPPIPKAKQNPVNKTSDL